MIADPRLGVPKNMGKCSPAPARPPLSHLSSFHLDGRERASRHSLSCAALRRFLLYCPPFPPGLPPLVCCAAAAAAAAAAPCCSPPSDDRVLSVSEGSEEAACVNREVNRHARSPLDGFLFSFPEMENFVLRIKS